MATWTAEQQHRLAFEEHLLTREFPHFSFYDRPNAGQTSVRGEHTTSAHNTYRLYVWIKEAFPYEIPALYVTKPCPLYGYRGKTIQSWGTSSKMHVWAPDWDNYVKICHRRVENWTASDTIIGVLMKGLLWLEAFEAHCVTGQNIDVWSLED